MLRKIKIWWYLRCLEGARIDGMSAEVALNDAQHRVAVYKYRIRQLNGSEDTKVTK